MGLDAALDGSAGRVDATAMDDVAQSDAPSPLDGGAVQDIGVAEDSDIDADPEVDAGMLDAAHDVNSDSTIGEDTGGVESGTPDTGTPDVGVGDGGVADTSADMGSPDAGTNEPWPPPELEHSPDSQPSGNGWRTAQWNICTTAMSTGRLECRAKIEAIDATRTAVELERAAIAKYFAEDSNLYSITLQEVCEEDVRWIAAFVANNGPPAPDWRGNFSDTQYGRIDANAPYAFLAYRTREMLDGRDQGCGPGISTGFAAIAKRLPGSTGFSTRGLTNATFASRAAAGFTEAQLRTASICEDYFNAQTSYGPVDMSTGQYERVLNFRNQGCASTVPDTLRGLACVRTRWRGPGDAPDRSYRVTTCATHCRPPRRADLAGAQSADQSGRRRDVRFRRRHESAHNPLR